MANAHVLYTRQFTPEYVGELREENKKRRIRNQLVEGAACKLAVETEAFRRGLDPDLFPLLTIEGVSIDAVGNVVGAAEAVRRAMIRNIPEF